MFGPRSFGFGGRSAAAFEPGAWRGGVGDAAKSFFMFVTNTVGAWQERSAARRRLGSFDDRMLRDIGLDRATADAEAAKPFWRD